LFDYFVFHVENLLFLKILQNGFALFKFLQVFSNFQACTFFFG
jgi:hypothetical protein